MLSLRRKEGISLHRVKENFSSKYYLEFEKMAAAEVKKGNLAIDGDIIKIPPELLFLSDGIIRDLIL
ncbi:MAG: hypothetical protein ACD_77C00223G0002 [uncultured bacterium]|nr:MAG: hypothetical protein ACD_77C00223G0002 [uncultured bacterium]